MSGLCHHQNKMLQLCSHLHEAFWSAQLFQFQDWFHPNVDDLREQILEGPHHEIRSDTCAMTPQEAANNQ